MEEALAKIEVEEAKSPVLYQVGVVVEFVDVPNVVAVSQGQTETPVLVMEIGEEPSATKPVQLIP